MGGGGSVPHTPLEGMLRHFKEAFVSQDYGIKWSKEKLKTLCDEEWPTFKLGWPIGGTFDPSVITRVHKKVFHPTEGHPDQAPYIDVWLSLVQQSRTWKRVC